IPWPRCSANWPKRLRSIFWPVLDASSESSIFCPNASGRAAVRVVRIMVISTPGMTRGTLWFTNHDEDREVIYLSFSEKAGSQFALAIASATGAVVNREFKKG